MSSAETIVTRKSSKAGLVLGLLATLAVTGGLAFVVGTKVLSPKEVAVADAGPSSEAHDTTTTTTATTSVTIPSSNPATSASVVATSDPEPVVTASAKVTLVKPPASTTAPSAPSGKTTGTVKVKKSGWGHRVFIDGQVAGQGGKDITWQCGSHRAKVGSAGKESTIDIPCGGTVEID
jgi:hypothetical protein